MSRNRFTEGFKRDAVAQVVDRIMADQRETSPIFDFGDQLIDYGAD